MFTWSNELETKNATIDGEHRQLINAINALLTACSEGHGREQLQKTAQFLYDYTNQHFFHEEQLQKQSRYPGYAQHLTYHQEFKRVVRQLCQELKEQGATVSMVAKVNQQIGMWLVNHIKREDAKVAAHIRETKTA